MPSNEVTPQNQRHSTEASPRRKPGTEDRWWRYANTRRFLERNDAFRFFANWLVAGMQRPATKAPDWSRTDRQSFEFLFWLYEIDARKRKYFLFGAPVAELNWDELTKVIRPAHPIKGCLPQWMDRAASDIGPPLGLKNDR